MRIAIVILGTFPEGVGCVAYNTKLGRGFIESGHEAECLVPYPVLSQTEKHDPVGNVRGITYRYTCGFSRCDWKMPGFLKRILLTCYGTFKLFKYLSEQEKIGKSFDALVVGTEWFLVIPVRWWAKRHHIPMVGEFFEYPLHLIAKQKMFDRFMTKVSYRCYDGIIAISNVLEDYYMPLMSKRCKTIVSPLLMEQTSELVSTPKGKYIAYSGDMNGIKDDIDLLLKSFFIFGARNQNVSLILFGACSEKRLSVLKEKVREAGMEDRITFYGFATEKVFLEYMHGASLLTIPKSDNLQNRGNFPSKLGVYLATGAPVLASDVGSLSKYFKDGEDIYLVEPDNVNAFAEKLEYIFAHEEEAKAVGKKGKENGYRMFSCKYQAGRIADFMSELKGNI